MGEGRMMFECSSRAITSAIPTSSMSTFYGIIFMVVALTDRRDVIWCIGDKICIEIACRIGLRGAIIVRSHIGLRATI